MRASGSLSWARLTASPSFISCSVRLRTTTGLPRHFTTTDIQDPHRRDFLYVATGMAA
ncbi:MAG: hypothetical protein E5V22_25580, partial [Mesorhizobium sp.]